MGRSGVVLGLVAGGVLVLGACSRATPEADTSLPPIPTVVTGTTPTTTAAPTTIPPAPTTTSVLSGAVTLVPPASYPDGMWAPIHTPGSVLVLNAQGLCQPGYGKTVSAVPESEKRQVLAEYGLTSSTGYIIDHLVSVDLGGSNNLDNLWPEQTGESKSKDVVDNALHLAVCAGQMSLTDAQEQMATWWTAPSDFAAAPASNPGGTTPTTARRSTLTRAKSSSVKTH